MDLIINFLPGMFGFGITVLMCLMVLKIFPGLNILDNPIKYSLPRKPVPYSAGIVFLIAFILGVIIWGQFSWQIMGVLLASVILVVTCFIDDRKGLSPFLRLFVQFICSVILVLVGIGIYGISNPFGGEIGLVQWEYVFEMKNIVFTLTLLADFVLIIWVMSMINIVNWLDGLNGLASGVSGICFFVIYLLASKSGLHIIDQTFVQNIALLMAGSCFAFTIFDFYPAKILMGDTGSMFLGFLIAVLAVFSGGKMATAILILGFPILDAFWVILRRIYQKKSPFKGDAGHLHHRLLRVGMTDRQALLFNYTFAALFGATALLLDNAYEKLIGITCVVVLMFFIALFVTSKKVVSKDS